MKIQELCFKNTFGFAVRSLLCRCRTTCAFERGQGRNKQCCFEEMCREEDYSRASYHDPRVNTMEQRVRSVVFLNKRLYSQRTKSVQIVLKMQLLTWILER